MERGNEGCCPNRLPAYQLSHEHPMIICIHLHLSVLWDAFQSLPPNPVCCALFPLYCRASAFTVLSLCPLGGPSSALALFFCIQFCAGSKPVCLRASNTGSSGPIPPSPVLNRSLETAIQTRVFGHHSEVDVR